MNAAAPTLPAALPDDVAALIQSGVSITVASRDDRLVPSIAKAVGCRGGAGPIATSEPDFAQVRPRSDVVEPHAESPPIDRGRLAIPPRGAVR